MLCGAKALSKSIRIAEKQEKIAACMDLRWAVFVQEQGVPEEEEIDGEDDMCSHVLAQVGDRPVGAARFKFVNGYVKIQRVCVPKSERGKNIGADIIRFIVRHVQQASEATSVRLGAQVHALDFYRKLGFQEFGGEYMDAGIPHMDMQLDLNS